MHTYKRFLFILPILSVIFLNPSTQAYAWFFNFGEGEHHDHGGYTEVSVGGGGRYYYNDGVFYTGAPGSYVAVQAPVGAIVYSAPADFEQVNVDGVVYYRSHDVYYRHEGRGYRVVGRPQEHHHEGEHH